MYGDYVVTKIAVKVKQAPKAEAAEDEEEESSEESEHEPEPVAEIPAQTSKYVKFSAIINHFTEPVEKKLSKKEQKRLEDEEFARQM